MNEPDLMLAPIRWSALLGGSVVSWWAWPAMVVALLAVGVMWMTPAKDQGGRMALLLFLSLGAWVVQTAFGYKLKSEAMKLLEWSDQVEERLSVLERSTRSNHAKTQIAPPEMLQVKSMSQPADTTASRAALYLEAIELPVSPPASPSGSVRWHPPRIAQMPSQPPQIPEAVWVGPLAPVDLVGYLDSRTYKPPNDKSSATPGPR